MTLWTRHTDNVSQKILSVNLCLIQKKVNKLPQNLSNAHWMVTFVFNPSSTDKDTENRPGFQTCFKVCQPFLSKLGFELKQNICKGSGISTSNHAD